MRLLFGDCSLDPMRRELLRRGEVVHVEPQVFDLLVHLIRNRHRSVSKDDLLAAVWSGRIVSDSTLDSRINAARRAIGDSGERQSLIRTLPRRGFRFVGDVREEPGESESTPDRQTATPLERGGGRPTVAVLPFDDMSGDPRQEYFSEGITEDIITVLSKYRSLLVIARNSAFAFKGHGGDVRRIGTELGADYVVEGSVRRIGRDVRITAHLIETEGGRVLWAEQYDRVLEQIFTLQDEIARTVAARIEPGIGTAECRRAERKPPQDLHAWDLFHLGMKHFYRFSAEENQQAQELFRRTLVLDPNLAQAYAFASYSMVLGMLYFEAEPDEHRLSEAQSLARTGVQLDEQDALVRFTHGRVLLARGAYGDALAELETALELNPSLPAIYCGLGDTLAYEGRFEEAIPHFEKAIRLSPYDPQRWATRTAPWRGCSHSSPTRHSSGRSAPQRRRIVTTGHLRTGSRRSATCGAARNASALLPSSSSASRNSRAVWPAGASSTSSNPLRWASTSRGFAGQAYRRVRSCPERRAVRPPAPAAHLAPH